MSLFPFALSHFLFHRLMPQARPTPSPFGQRKWAGPNVFGQWPKVKKRGNWGRKIGRGTKKGTGLNEKAQIFFFVCRKTAISTGAGRISRGGGIIMADFRGSDNGGK
jgi:hypothetical protein